MITVCFLSAPEDKALFTSLSSHLAPYRRLHPNDVRYDTTASLESAEVTLIFFSASFLGSDTLYDQAMRAFERSTLLGTTVIPILARNCSLTDTPFRVLQYLPLQKTKTRKTTLQDGDDIIAECAESILQVLDDLLQEEQ